MIDFTNGSYVKLGQSDLREILPEITPMFAPGEQAYVSFKGIRDSVVFTNKRIITINVQGISGKKRDYTSLPYSKIQAYSIETAGTFDLDGELELWLSGLGKVRLEFKGNVDLRALNQIISSAVL